MFEGKTKENYACMKVDKILSYQTQVYKNGHRTFPKASYKRYKRELGSQLKNMANIWHKRGVEIRMKVHSVNDTIGDEDNIKKPIYDTLEDYHKLFNDRYVRFSVFEKDVEAEENKIEVMIINREYVLYDKEQDKFYVGTKKWLSSYLRLPSKVFDEFVESGEYFHDGRFQLRKISNTSKTTYK